MKLIVIEGTDGSGKKTQSQILYDRLKEKYKNVFLISFPNYGSEGCKLVEKYLKGEIDPDPNKVNCYIASTFYAIDRYMYFKENDFPADSILICDRYVTSNLIHQMAKINEHKWFPFSSWLNDLEYHKYGIPMPTLELYLYLEPETSIKLVESRYNGDDSKKDIHENIEFLKQSTKPIQSFMEGNAYSRAIFGQAFRVIKCEDEKGNLKSIEDISEMVWDKVQEVL